MKAMILRKTGPLDDRQTPLELVELPQPKPEPQQVLIKVLACGVCHTELDEIEGRMPPSILPIVLGHQVVRNVIELGTSVTRHIVGNRVGVGWIFQSDGSKHENLSSSFRATGRDANGGYAEFMTVHENYAFPIPDSFTDQQAAPLLCAGAIGYRALRLTTWPTERPLD